MTKAARSLRIGLLALCVTAGCQPKQKTDPSQGNDSPPGSQPPTATDNQQPSDSPPPTLTVEDFKSRVSQVWEARKQQDWAKVFEYHPPDVRMGWVVDDFVKWSSDNEPFIVEDYTIRTVTFADGIGWAEVDYQARIRPYLDLPARSATTIERWRLVDGQWYMVVGKDLRYSLSPPWTRDESQEPYLRARFDETWQYRQNGDWRSLWEMVDVNTRNEDEFDEFVEAQNLVRFTEHDLRWVEVIGDRGRICVMYRFQLNDPNLSKLKTEPKTVIENWTKREDQWYIQKTGN